MTTFEEKLDKARELLAEAFQEIRDIEEREGEVVYVIVDRKTGKPMTDEDGFFDGAIGDGWDPGDGTWRAYIPLYKDWESEE